MFFDYGNDEIECLAKKDRKLGEIIKRIGIIKREVEPDLFAAVVLNIVGQQISGKAFVTVEKRLRSAVKELTPQTIANTPDDVLQKCGMSMRKVRYIKDFTEKVCNGEFNIEHLATLGDAEVVAELSSLRGIGVWTAEMLLLFSLQRPDVLSFGDLGIQKGMRMVYRHRKITKELFAKYRRRLSPLGSIASLYFWEIASGAISELTDPATRKRT